MSNIKLIILTDTTTTTTTGKYSTASVDYIYTSSTHADHTVATQSTSGTLHTCNSYIVNINIIVIVIGPNIHHHGKNHKEHTGQKNSSEGSYTSSSCSKAFSCSKGIAGWCGSGGVGSCCAYFVLTTYYAKCKNHSNLLPYLYP